MRPLIACSILAIGGLLLPLGCATDSDLSDKAFAERYTAGSQFHPWGAHLTRDDAIRLGARAYEQLGFRPEDLGNAGALYIGPTRGFLGIKHKTWDVSFKNKSPGSAARYPTLSVYVDDRSGKAEVVEKGAHP
jgi:hypothetical protein